MLLPTYCAGCNEPGSVLCRSCRFILGSAAACDNGSGVVAPLAFEGVARQVVHGLKYRNRRAVAKVLAELIVRRVRVEQVDLVTWAPTSSARVRQRGFDQAELLARAVARELGLPCRRLLYRTHGPVQTGHTRAERLRGPEFRAQAGSRRTRVLLIDDVVTTGATMAAACRALHRAGIDEVLCVAAAATPARTQARRPLVPAA